MLGLIAKSCGTPNLPTQAQLAEFYVKQLDFKPRTLEDREDLYYDDVLESVKLGRDHLIPVDLSSSDDGEDIMDDDESGEESEDPFFTDTNHKALLDLQERKMAEEQNIALDWDALMTELESCPKIPKPPVVEQINPPPYAMPRILFGKLMPKPEDEEKKKGAKKKPAAKPAAKKDGPPEKPPKWADGPPELVEKTSVHVERARKQLASNVFPMNLRGEQGNPGVAPCVIKEVYFPPEAPYDVATLIESSLVY